MTMQTENTKELTKEQMLWNRFHKAWDINSTAYHSNVVDSVNICLDFSKQELQQANKEIERLKGKTNYDEVEVLKQQLKAKDELLEKMADMLDIAKYHYGSQTLTLKYINELLNQYNQSK